VAAGAKPRPRFEDRSAPRAPLQLWRLPVQPDGTPLRKPAAARAATQAVAGEVARLLAAARRGEVQLDGRPLAAGDIAVLVRRHAQGAAMRRALAALGVGSVELSQADVHRSLDAEELEQVLAAMLSPTREGLLRAALATGLMGLDATDVARLADDEATLLHHVARFTVHRDTWLQQGVGPMLRRWLQQEQVAPRLLLRTDGERRLTNLLHLAERLQAATADHPAPEALLRWLQRQRTAGGGGDAAQLRLESDRDLVQIVTIHKSKGLEYPLVFCPFLWDGHPGRALPQRDARDYHDAQGRPVVDFRPGALPAEVKRQQELERIAEQARLVYVALTRAVHACHVYALEPTRPKRAGGKVAAHEGVDAAPLDVLMQRMFGARPELAAALKAGEAPALDPIGLRPAWPASTRTRYAEAEVAESPRRARELRPLPARAPEAKHSFTSLSRAGRAQSETLLDAEAPAQDESLVPAVDESRYHAATSLSSVRNPIGQAGDSPDAANRHPREGGHPAKPRQGQDTLGPRLRGGDERGCCARRCATNPKSRIPNPGCSSKRACSRPAGWAQRSGCGRLQAGSYKQRQQMERG